MDSIFLLPTVIIAASIATGYFTWQAAVKKYRKKILELEKEVLELSWYLLGVQKNEK